MLRLENITKDYITGNSKVEALKGITLQFRKSEFVSILGQSGCGKTTLLNIIGGLDRYTTGDLVINGKSTKEFKDRNWDSYRNHSVGFVFQTYNLIPHQTILSNVELALTLSGVSKSERKKKAIKALEEVGLGEQINKKPNQLSGGQMQRVAIARALVNDPEIILADEPTGALDTKTSVQVMEILKKISKDRLIIMVTHNPDLAEKYSSRIIKILDGKITDDSNPYSIEAEEKEDRTSKVNSKVSMSFFTALSLSLNNLMTKKGRTFLTSFAGSIGIIGIALILSLSSGMQTYINRVEEDTLSSYPITIQEETIDMASMMTSLMGNEEDNIEHEEGKVYSSNIVTDMLSTISTKVQSNNLEEFKKYLDDENSSIRNYINAVEYSYNLDLNIYKENDEKIVQVNPSQIFSKLGMGDMENMMFAETNVWQELLDNQELLKSQYDVLAGKWPEKYNEVVLIVDENNEILDYTLYALGILDQDELEDKYEAILDGKEVEDEETKVYSYEDLLNTKFKILLNTDYYEKDGDLWIDKSKDNDYIKEKVEDAEEISIVGIIRPSQGTVATAMSGTVGYLSDLEEYVINKINDSEIVKEQKENKDINVFTSAEFPEDTDEEFDFSSLTQEQRMYLASLSQEEMVELMQQYTENANATYEGNLEKLGVVDLEKPSSISIYPKDFESKEQITLAIEEYNQKQRDEGKEENVITYTDLVGTMMSSVSTIIDAISYVLIAFVAISLVVSSIMIGIITYISVLERTKEIGILRSIGASKKDISRVFNAETFIVGLGAGILGIGVTLLLNIPINLIIKAVTDIPNLASLPLVGGIILVVISMLLTVIAGLIPAKMASKKDPVEALRTE